MPLRNGRLAAAWFAIGLLAPGAATAQPALNNNAPDEPEWVESDVPPAPSFDVNRLVEVNVDARGSLQYGIDPATVQIGTDGVVRYVMVARSRTGAMTAMYEGVRCNTGDYKLYARYNAGRWTPSAAPDWKSLWESTRIKHPLAFARQGGCDSRATPRSVDEIVRRLKSPGETVYPS